MVVRKKSKYVEAYQLGENTKKEQELIDNNLIKLREDGLYEIISQETVDGSGEIAKTGDYIKIDNASFPYPNDRIFFEQNHRKIGENLYEQIPKELLAWNRDEQETVEVRFLKQNKGLILSESKMIAPLWGSVLSADKDAIIIFYSIIKDKKGNIIDIDFNFVTLQEFQKTYEIVK